MKQAILILCGHEKDRLPFLIDQFDYRFNIYIHIDQKVDVSQTFIDCLTKRETVKFVSQLYTTNWGGMNIVNAMLHLCKESLFDDSCSHFHLISGADFPVASNDDICSRFKSEKDNHIVFFKLPSLVWKGGGLNRLQLFHPFDDIDIRTSEGQEKYLKFINYQNLSGIRRQILNIPYYGGSMWWSLSRKYIEYLITNQNAYNLYASMQYTYAPDEMFVQTLLLNSYLKPNLINNNLRYIVWRYKNGNCPANLDMDDFEEIMKSNCIFMRKVDKECSWDLVKRIAEIRKSI